MIINKLKYVNKTNSFDFCQEIISSNMILLSKEISKLLSGLIKTL